MRRNFPPKLKPGDLVALIAPSQSLQIVRKKQQELAQKRLEEMGFRVCFGKHVNEYDDFESSSIASRVEDLHAAFANREVKGVLAVEGGFNCNQLLKYLDWNLIKRNPKVFCGYSDITVLNNAMLAKAGLVTYSGPLFGTFGQKKYFEYTREYFKKCVMDKEPYELKASEIFIDDDWEADQENVHPAKNQGVKIINEGVAEGVIIGGNLSSVGLLQGTEYMPDWSNAILFLEDDYEWQAHHFDRCFQSLLQQSAMKKVKGVVWGRTDRYSKISDSLMRQMNQKRELEHLPVVFNANFGHTTPMATLPIGGKVRLEAKSGVVKLMILEH